MHLHVGSLLYAANCKYPECSTTSGRIGHMTAALCGFFFFFLQSVAPLAAKEIKNKRKGHT